MRGTTNTSKCRTTTPRNTTGGPITTTEVRGIEMPTTGSLEMKMAKDENYLLVDKILLGLGQRTVMFTIS
jgi:hypothetical protein